MRRHVSMAVLLGLFLAFPAWATPALISYQTRLDDGSGNPITSVTQLRVRIYSGGDATTNPSPAPLVYHELISVTPTADGVVSFMIGSGSPQQPCGGEVPCSLTASDFPDGSTPLWIEVMIDPNGVLGDYDDDVLLPRTQFGSVGYAMQADTLDGRDADYFLDGGPGTQSKSGTLIVGDLSCADCLGASDIGTGAVGSSEVADNSLTAADLAPNSVGASEIVDGGVGTAEVANDSLTASDLAPNSVTSSELANNAVGTAELQDGSVTSSKLALSVWFSPVWGQSSETETVHDLGNYRYCALSQIAYNSFSGSGTNTWCRITTLGSLWRLGVRGNNTTYVACQAVCF